MSDKQELIRTSEEPFIHFSKILRFHEIVKSNWKPVINKSFFFIQTNLTERLKIYFVHWFNKHFGFFFRQQHFIWYWKFTWLFSKGRLLWIICAIKFEPSVNRRRGLRRLKWFELLRLCVFALVGHNVENTRPRTVYSRPRII